MFIHVSWLPVLSGLFLASPGFLLLVPVCFGLHLELAVAVVLQLYRMPLVRPQR